MRNDQAKSQPKCVFIHPRKGIHCTMHALPGSKYCIRHQQIRETNDYGYSVLDPDATLIVRKEG